ncbi:dethiobiotin synthase, partial [Priestia megaterium]
MGKAYFITGTGTDIGKTLVTSILYKVLGRLGIKTTICKP